MPTEFRRITFGADELIDAIAEYDRYAGQRLTCGFIVGLEIFDEPLVTASVEVKIMEEENSIKIACSSKEIGAALVMYCLTNNIPIPTKAVRYLKSSGNKLSLYISMDEAVEGPATILPDFFDFDLNAEVAAAA